MIKSISKAIKFNVVTCGFRRETVQAGWVCCTKCSENAVDAFCLGYHSPLFHIKWKCVVTQQQEGFTVRLAACVKLTLEQNLQIHARHESLEEWGRFFFFFLKKPANVSEHLQRSGISRWNNFWWMCCVVDFTAWEKSEACLVKQSFYFIVSLRSKCG